MDLPKGKIGTAEFTGATASTLPLLADKAPVTDFVIFKPGVNDSDYGPVVFDEIAAAFVMQNWADRGNQLKFDYNHGMALKYATAEQGKSAGDFDLAVEDGALKAVGCMWTAEAFQRIKGGEYGLFSPWFDYIDTDDGIRRPFKINNVAILNNPGLYGIDQIAAGAASTATTETTMNEAEIKALQDRNAKLETENQTLRIAASEVVHMGNSLELGASAGPTERASALHGLVQLRGEVLRITGKGTLAEAVGELHAIQARAGEAGALQATIEAAEQTGLQKEIDHAFEMGAKAGSTGAAPAARKAFEDGPLAAMKRINGGKLSADMVVVAKSHVEMAAKVNVGGAGGNRQPAPGAGGASGAPLPPELQKLSGVSQASLQKAYDRQNARRFGNTGGAA